MGNAVSDNRVDTSGCFESIAERCDETGEWAVRAKFAPYLEQLSDVMEVKKNMRSAAGQPTGEWHISSDFAWHPSSKLTADGLAGKMLRRVNEDLVDAIPYNRLKRVAVPSSALQKLKAGEPLKRDERREEAQLRLLRGLPE